MHLFKWTFAIGLSFLAMVGGVNHVLVESMPTDVQPYYLSTPFPELQVRAQPFNYYDLYNVQTANTMTQVTYNPQGGQL